MWNSCSKFKRLEKALEYRGLNAQSININDLARVLKKRGITDKIQDSIVCPLINVLEPPACQMTHCKHNGGSTAFCNCGKELLPNKCKIYRAYLKRRKEKAIKVVNKLLELMNEHFKKDIIYSMSVKMESYKFYEYLIKEGESFYYLKKWSYNLRVDAWKEIQKRIDERAE